jgi:hypothetical protein
MNIYDTKNKLFSSEIEINFKITGIDEGGDYFLHYLLIGIALLILAIVFLKLFV